MADVKVKIKLQDTVEDTIDKIRVDSTSNALKIGDEFVNNVSIYHPPKLDMSISSSIEISKFNPLSTKNNGANLKSWATGKLSLADGYVGGSNTTLGSWRGYNGYVFGAVPESKQFEVTLAFFGENIDSIIIYGDKTANQFPTKAYLDSNSADLIYSDDPVWAIRFENPSDTHTITFLEWNRGNYNACITFVAVLKNELELDKSYIKNIESLSQITAQPKEIHYGALENRGDLELYDIDKEFVDYINDGVLVVNNLPISVYVGDNKIQEHITEDTEYDPHTFVMSMPLTNKFERIDNIDKTINLRDYASSTSDNKGTDLKYILKYFVFDNWNIDDKLKNKIIVRLPTTSSEYVQYKEITIDEHLSNIRIPYVFFTNKTKADILNEICNLAQINYVLDDNGNDVFISAKPLIIKDTKTIINLDKKNIVGQISKDIIVKNKIDKVRFNITNVDVSQDVIYNKNISLQSNPEILGSKASEVYDISSMGNNAQIIDGEFTQEGVYRGYLCFFDSVSYTSDTFYKFNLLYGSNTNTQPYYIKLSYMTSDTNNVISTTNQLPRINGTEESKDEYSFSENLGYVKLLDTDNFNDNNQSYNIAVSIDLLDPQGFYMNPLQNVELKLFGTIYKISTNEKTFGNGNNEYLFMDSSLMQTNSIYQYNSGLNEIKLNEFIANDILTNYANGIRTCECSVTCSTYYDVDGNKAIDWDKNEILKIGDFVKLYNDDIVWKVVGRNFRKQGVPMIDLTLMQVIEVDKIVEI